MLISPDEINKTISNQNWSYRNNRISKSFEFESYIEGLNFVNEIAKIAEQRNHHPDINIGWCKVEISITSHDLGGVTTKCVNLATTIDSL
jgi:4a-hydroxytetrahydrobiopterin dehydratase